MCSPLVQLCFAVSYNQGNSHVNVFLRTKKRLFLKFIPKVVALTSRKNAESSHTP